MPRPRSERGRVPFQVIRMGPEGLSVSGEFGLYPESRGDTEGLLSGEQMLNKGEAREWRGQVIPRFLA